MSIRLRSMRRQFKLRRSVYFRHAKAAVGRSVFAGTAPSSATTLPTTSRRIEKSCGDVNASAAILPPIFVSAR